MNFIGIIPARYASTRFPGKPLVEIDGKPMIQRVYEQARITLDHVYVATDDDRIVSEVAKFKGNVIMTSKSHQSGTDRLAEAIQKIQNEISKKFDVVINIQGDEPFIQPGQIKEIMSCFDAKDTEIATLIKKIDQQKEIFDVNKPKVIFDKFMNAIYFSRSPIPFVRSTDQLNWFKAHEFYRHIGMYAYKTKTLIELTNLEVSSLEIAESLEQNRWIENGYKIRVTKSQFDSLGIDTPEDLLKALDK